jgi:hypothetical protein
MADEYNFVSYVEDKVRIIMNNNYELRIPISFRDDFCPISNVFLTEDNIGVLTFYKVKCIDDDTIKNFSFAVSRHAGISVGGNFKWMGVDVI